MHNFFFLFKFKFLFSVPIHVTATDQSERAPLHPLYTPCTAPSGTWHLGIQRYKMSCLMSNFDDEIEHVSGSKGDRIRRLFRRVWSRLHLRERFEARLCCNLSSNVFRMSSEHRARPHATDDQLRGFRYRYG